MPSLSQEDLDKDQESFDNLLSVVRKRAVEAAEHPMRVVGGSDMKSN
jgi:hypothetical protein